ncbi:hypothetical protein FH972_007558 [Carpinus fangiana]|uniref:AAA+ ATPase domain-containing protein n=1 Tax=Carpinus fangiana TaxID=176857 RepID=A0A5N6QWU0_9ROSI|nr:hypothetical protein FH972_007558 [Carpinus fangiana]
MSPALSLSLSHPFCKSQDLPKSTSRENPRQKTPSDIKLSRRKLLNSTGLGLVGGGLSVAQPARAEPESPAESTSSRMSYSRFLQYLDEGAVKKVDLFENGTVAIAEIFNPTLDKIQRVKIQLPGLPQELLRKMEEKNVDFAAHPLEINQWPAILDLLGNFAFPLILLGSLLLRTSSTNTPGGPNLPFGLGRSKAKFQMEPNTGVTFDDVAGVDEAKQDFQEIVEFLKTPEKFAAVAVGIPDVRGREEILKVHGNNKKLDKDVSLSVIAMRTPGFCGADLANLMNEAAILAGRRGKQKITMKEIDDSIDRIVAGMEGTKMTDGKRKILVAYHEIGHSVCATLTPGHDPVQKVTLIPRGQARGLTWFMPGEDPALISKQQLFARIVGGLGGRAAEEVIFGESEITTGAAGDLQQITQIARQMVTMFGMSDIGPWALTDPAVESSDVVLRMLARNSRSEKLAEDIDSSVRGIIESAYEIAKNHIRHNREAIDKLVDVLVEKETLTGDEFRAILSEFTDISAIKIASTPVREMIEA